MKKLKRAVIKEELVALTGDFIGAIILNQFIYWSERVKDFDKFIQEEIKRAANEGQEINIELTNGWIYKKSEELSEETMLGLSKSNMRRHITSLVNNGWLSERQNPKYKWDRTLQYRVNLKNISDDLKKKGYEMQGYKALISNENITVSNQNVEGNEIELPSSDSELQVLKQNCVTIDYTTDITLKEKNNNNIVNDEIELQEKEQDVVVVESIQNKFLEKTNNELPQHLIQKMLKKQSVEKIEEYIDNLDKFVSKSTNPVGLLINAVTGAWAIPKEMKGSKQSNNDEKPIYKQILTHNYSKADNENLYLEL